MTDPHVATSQRDRSALLLVGHGTRDAQGVAELLEIAGRVADRLGDLPVAPCFLEIATPTIAEVVASLARRGIGRLSIMPMLLFAAGHVKRDIPGAVAAAVEPYANLVFRLARHYGCHEAILNLSALRLDEALADKPELPPAETVLLLVGRGSRDPEARVEMIHFCELRAARSPVGRVEPCFLAVAKPSLDEALSTVGALPAKRVVVQPHLLFRGELVDQVHVQVANARRRFPEKEWIVTKHLGPHELLIEATISLAAEDHAANLSFGRDVEGRWRH